MLGEVQYSATQAADVLTMQNFQINFPQDFGNWRFPQDLVDSAEILTS